MNIDNLHEQISFINSVEAGEFLSWAVEQKFSSPINGNNIGTISLQDVIYYVEKKTGKKAILLSEGLNAPYNGQKSFSLDVSYANDLGYSFPELNGWIYELLDKYIDMLI